MANLNGEKYKRLFHSVIHIILYDEPDPVVGVYEVKTSRIKYS